MGRRELYLQMRDQSLASALRHEAAAAEPGNRYIKQLLFSKRDAALDRAASWEDRANKEPPHDSTR